MYKTVQNSANTPEILLFDKPLGWSSFDVIRHLRKALGIRKLGHAGTLDPLATGLMIIGVGAGTRKLKDLIGLDKEYEADILLGERTTTGDAEGEVVEKVEVSEIDSKYLLEVVEGMKGELKLPVPAYSAIKVKGQRLYKLARQGMKIELPVKSMKIYSIKLLRRQPVRASGGVVIIKVQLSVSSGTYIRSVAEELGRRLGLPARLNALRRTRIGAYTLEQPEVIKP